MTAQADEHDTVFVDLSGLSIIDLLDDDGTQLAVELRRVADLAGRRTGAVAGFQSYAGDLEEAGESP